MTNPAIAVVTGASRGAGKGIAIGLGEKGMTVFVTGRSVDQSDAVGWDGKPLAGSMMGGNFVYSSDSRYRNRVNDYPTPVHDRVEH